MTAALSNINRSPGGFSLIPGITLVLILCTLPSPTSTQQMGASIANCLERSGGLYNIGCPGLQHLSRPPVCILDGPTTERNSPYDRICDGIVDCNETLPVDENNFLDCKNNYL